MSIGEATGLVAALMVMMLGLVGSVLPILPGAPPIFLAALAHKLCLQERSVGWWVVLVLGGLTGLTLLLDFASSTYGAKRFGATWRGIIGAGLGAIVGILLFPPWGLIVGPWIGAMLAELIGGRGFHEAGRAGFGAALGTLAGSVGKMAICLAMVGLWVVALLSHAFTVG
jgi:uncharacterized protein YqgC (DUF456 family)